MLVVGLTGGIASGKSTVSTLLAEQHDLPIVDADILAREVIAPGTSGYKLVVSHFGPDRVLLEDGVTLNRAAIGDIVFKDAEERRWLNAVVHPRVRSAMAKQVLACWLRGEWCVIVDVPLLIEAGLWKWVGEVVVVYVNERIQFSRLMARPSNPPLTDAQATARISAQLPMASKVSYANSVLDNSGTFAELEDQVNRLVAKWRAQQGGSSGWWWKLCWFIPPVGLVAAWQCLLGTWIKSKKGARRRARGEVERVDKFEMKELRRRRGTDSSEGDVYR